MTSSRRRLRVLSIDGGGMRGLYSSAYLCGLAKQAEARRSVHGIDIGKAFDLIVGTSTGGVIACALAAGISLDKVVEVYSENAKAIFPAKVPDRVSPSAIWRAFRWPQYLARGSRQLEIVLSKVFGETTLDQVYNERGIALSITAVEMSHHRSWVFKTPHLGGRRDERFRLVDVCLATSAAPLYRSMARVSDPTSDFHRYTFVDGGLWANNPVLVAMIDALRMSKPGDRIDIFSLGTSPRPPGGIYSDDDAHRGFFKWKFGGEAATVSLDSQTFAYDKMARMLAQHVDRDCRVIRLPTASLPADAMPYVNLDETSRVGLQALTDQAMADVWHTLGICDDSSHQDGLTLSCFMNALAATGDDRSLR